MSADSQEEKTSSSVGRGSRSPETSSAPLGLGGPCEPCGASICKQEGSGELQSVSGGTFLIVKTCIGMQGGGGAAWGRGGGKEGGHAEETPAYVMMSGFDWFV